MDLNDIKITNMGGNQINVSSLEAGCSGQSKTLEAAIAQFAMAYHDSKMMEIYPLVDEQLDIIHSGPMTEDQKEATKAIDCILEH